MLAQFYNFDKMIVSNAEADETPYELRRKPLLGSDTVDSLFFKIATVVPLEAVPGSSPGATIFKKLQKNKNVKVTIYYWF